MTTTIQGPDGALIDFPDNTSEAEMNAAMAQAYPAPAQAAQPAVSGALKGASRALENNLPFVDRAVAKAKSVLPQGYGGTGQDYATNIAVERAKNAQFAEQNPMTNLVGGVVASAPLATIAGPTFGLGGLGGRMVASALPFGVAGAAQGASSSPDITNVPETAKDVAIGAGSGAALGAAAPLVASGVAKVISPFPVDATRQAFVDALRQAGIKPTAGQVTGNKTLAKLEAGASDIIGGPTLPREANNRAFTAALMEKAGAPPGQIATPENLNAAFDALGEQYKGLASRNAITVDPQLRQDIAGATDAYNRQVGPSNRAPGVEGTASDITDAPNGVIPGDAYQTQRSALTKQAQALRFSDPPLAQAARDMRNALDAAMERSINPDDAGSWAKINRNYGNLKDIGKARGSAGESAAMGQVTPAQMRTVLGSGNNRLDYARGKGDLAPLTNAANAILTNFPQSGTTPRILAAHLLGAGIGGAGGYQEGGLPGAAIGALVPAAAARALMSRPVQSLLANQLMRGPAPIVGANRAALAAALAARQQLPPQRNTAQ